MSVHAIVHGRRHEHGAGSREQQCREQVVCHALRCPGQQVCGGGRYHDEIGRYTIDLGNKWVIVQDDGSERFLDPLREVRLTVS